MKRILLSLALLAAACTAAPPPMPADPTIARIDTGKLKGLEKNGVIAFKGVPYAAPPVGDLRWRPPAPAIKWPGVRDASAVLLTVPAPTSSWVTVYVAVQVADAPGANVVSGQVATGVVPTSSPLTFTRAPPEFPGLIGASV